MMVIYCHIETEEPSAVGPLDPKDEDTKLLHNVGNLVPIYTVSCHRWL